MNERQRDDRLDAVRMFVEAETDAEREKASRKYGQSMAREIMGWEEEEGGEREAVHIDLPPSMEPSRGRITLGNGSNICYCEDSMGNLVGSGPVPRQPDLADDVEWALQQGKMNAAALVARLLPIPRWADLSMFGDGEE